MGIDIEFHYDLFGPFINIGPYWNHLDKLTDEDLEYYWSTTREEALKLKPTPAE